jgi:hypothetical protein
LLEKQNALLEAVLITFERLQGAIGADSEQFVIRQSEALVKFLRQLAETQQRLQGVIKRIQLIFPSILSEGVEQKLTQLAAQGFSTEERQLLQDAGLSPENIQILEQVLLSLPSNANFNDLVQQGLGQWKLLIGDMRSTIREIGYALKAGQLTYDCRYSTMHGMPVTGGRGFRGLKPLWYNGVPP